MSLFRVYVDGALFYHPQMSKLAITDARIEEDAENIDSMTLSAPFNHTKCLPMRRNAQMPIRAIACSITMGMQSIPSHQSLRSPRNPPLSRYTLWSKVIRFGVSQSSISGVVSAIRRSSDSTGSRHLSSIQGRGSRFHRSKGDTAMSDKQKVKIALAEAITKQLWVKGLITQQQREIIDKNSQKVLAKPNC